jgi:hypothetical protein
VEDKKNSRVESFYLDLFPSALCASILDSLGGRAGETVHRHMLVPKRRRDNI